MSKGKIMQKGMPYSILAHLTFACYVKFWYMWPTQPCFIRYASSLSSSLPLYMSSVTVFQVTALELDIETSCLKHQESRRACATAVCIVVVHLI